MSKQKVTVSINGEGEWEAYVDPAVRWNGWACPAFDRPAAEKVAATLAADTDEWGVRFRWDGDALFMQEGDGEQWYDEQQVGPDPDGRYPIGAYNWTWEVNE